MHPQQEISEVPPRDLYQKMAEVIVLLVRQVVVAASSPAEEVADGKKTIHGCVGIA